MSGKQRNENERCMHHLFSARNSNWTFRKKLISFSIIKFGYWKKKKKRCARERSETESVILRLCTYIRMCVEVWFWHAQTHTHTHPKWKKMVWVTRVHSRTHIPTSTREFRRVTKFCKKRELRKAHTAQPSPAIHRVQQTFAKKAEKKVIIWRQT